LADDFTKTISAAQEAMKRFDTLSTLPASTIQRLETARRAALPIVKAIEALNSSKQLHSALASLQRQQDQLKVVSLPAVLDKKILDQLSGFTRHAEAVGLAVSAFNARFELPKAAHIRGILDRLKTTNELTERTRLAMEHMRTPWLDIHNQLQSIHAFAELQNIGVALNRHSAFDDRLAEHLRSSLGDWRKTIQWPKEIFQDALERRAFYKERGLDVRLTNFPITALLEGLTTAGISTPLPQKEDVFSAEDSLHEVGFERNNAAHDLLQRFETQIRDFLEIRMADAFGADWIKHRVAGDMREQWQDKKEIARKNGEPERSLIAYADFTDYLTLIVRGDNWRDVFQAVFQRRESVQESFQRLYPVRICTMHARFIEQDDFLYLHVETKRLLKAIHRVR
jgi:hypothetical protein